MRWNPTAGQSMEIDAIRSRSHTPNNDGQWPLSGFGIPPASAS
jgi:hypothetical protein